MMCSLKLLKKLVAHKLLSFICVFALYLNASTANYNRDSLLQKWKQTKLKTQQGAETDLLQSGCVYLYVKPFNCNKNANFCSIRDNYSIDSTVFKLLKRN